MSSVKAANLFDVKGLVAVVTGGGTGIGLMLAKVLEENGAKVYIVGRRMDVLEKASNGHHGNIIPLQGDVSKKEDLLKIVDSITKTDGFINALIVNHGILGPDLNDIKPDQTLLEMQEVLWKANVDDFTNTYRVNTSAVYFSTIAFLGLLEAGNKQGNVVQKSQVIATASIGGLGRVARPGIAYVTSKAAVIHLMKLFATTFANHDIRSNVIAPGLYPSETTEKKIIPNFAPDGVFPRALIPLQRLGSIEDMAGAILYLTSQAGAFVNGNVIVTDGGSLSILPSSY